MKFSTALTNSWQQIRSQYNDPPALSLLEFDPAINADPAGWMKANFYIPELNAPMALYPSQEIPLQEALRREPGDLFAYSTVVWSAIKKSAKSSIAAAVGLWFAFRRPYASVKVIANDLKQADSRVFYYMTRAIELHPEWRDTAKITRHRIELENKSVIEAIPIDPTGEAGANDDCVIYSEIWGWKYGNALKMWTESTLSPLKFGQSLRWCETYSGYSGESPVLEQLYEQGVKQGRLIDEAYEMYANEAGRLFVLWNTQPHLPWQTPEYYSQEAATLTDSEYRRVHRNEWTSSEAQFIPIEWWDHCREEIPPLQAGDKLILGVDAAVSGDCFALVAVSRHKERVSVRAVRVWTPPKGGQIDFSAPEAEIARLARSHRVLEVAYDPYQLESTMQRLRKVGIHCRPFGQGQDRLIADKRLYDAIRDRLIGHDGNHDLREHLRNANAKTEGDKLRLVKRAEHLKIDSAVALSMATHRAMQLNLG